MGDKGMKGPGFPRVLVHPVTGEEYRYDLGEYLNLFKDENIVLKAIGVIDKECYSGDKWVSGNYPQFVGVQFSNDAVITYEMLEIPHGQKGE